MPPASRVADMHICPMVTPGTPPIPHVGGPVLPPGCPTVLMGMMPAARVGDMCVCVGPPDSIAMGSTSVITGYSLQARIGDPTIHGGSLILGFPQVMVGG
ncbi:MAG: PAAR domain-containing protein [Acidobacteriota bacterium]